MIGLTLPFWVLKATIFLFWGMVALACVLILVREIGERLERRREQRRGGDIIEALNREVGRR